MKKKSALALFFFIAWHLSYAQIPQLWGMTYFGGNSGDGNIFSINSDGSNFQSVFYFNGNNGENPENDLLQASNGNLYSVTFDGGMGTSTGNGTFFSIDPITDSFKMIYNFPKQPLGTSPQSNLIQLSNGLICGMTTDGGNSISGNMGGFGVIFSFNPVSNKYTRLYAFDSTEITGCEPAGQNIMQASNGKLYGFANDGAYYSSSQGVNSGVIFSFNLSDNVYTDLYDFDDTKNEDGNGPSGSLTQGAYGKLYGTTGGGGVYGDGVIFSFDTSSNTYKKLFDFDDTDGEGPTGSLVQLSNGKLYGTCDYGGYGDGTIFSYDPSDSSFERLYEFTGYSGENPYSNLILASDGKLYGTTANGGAYQQGNIYSFNPDSNTFKDIFDFDSTDGGYALSGLIEYNPNAGIKQFSVINNQLTIYPNPSGGTINIVSSKNIDALKVTNLLGQVIYTTQPKQMQFIFQLKDEGMYFITVTSENETQTKKVLVIK